MRLFFIFLFFGVYFSSTSQNQSTKIDSTALYKNYREDQFYASITYNTLNNKPNGISQKGFSSGFHFGFIRDMPINTRRNVALGLGIGLSSNSYNQTLLISENNGIYSYTAINQDEVIINKNKFTTYLIEVPFEFRWRTSTPTEYNFWRIYTGFKVGYVFYNSSKFISNTNTIRLSNINDFNKLQYGLTLSAGYGTWSFQLYYGLNTIFNNEATLNGNSLDISALKIGLMFYIL